MSKVLKSQEYHTDQIDDDLEWLELDEIPAVVKNPLIYPVGEKQPDPYEEMAEIFTDIDYLHFFIKHVLNVELPPYQCVIQDTLWRKRMPLMVGSRGLAKTFSLAIYCLSRMVLEPGYKIVIVGAGLRQARQVFDYMSYIWDRAPILRDIAGRGKTVGPRREVDRFQFEIGHSVAIAIPLGQGDKIRGLRANTVIVDETSVVPEEIFNVVVQGFAVVSKDPIVKIKEAATVRKLKRLGEWSEELEQKRKENAGGNQIVLAGTASFYFNHFYKNYKKYRDIILSKGDSKIIKEVFAGDEESAKGFNYKDFAILRIPYTAIPEGLLDPAIIAHAKATLTTNQFLLEYGATFITDSDGFYKRSILEQATTNKPIYTSDEFVQFSAYQTGEKDKAYVIGVDPAADVDNAAIVVVELNKGHRKIVHCWTTNKKKFMQYQRRMAKQNVEIGNDYYRFIAKKIRTLMRSFNTERIIMDKNGGGTAVAEALKSDDTYLHGELPVFEVPDYDNPKADDAKEGLHILKLIAPTNDMNADANHGMLKDFQDKVLLFPRFDTVELAKAIEMDRLIESDDQFDTYEDLVQELEELKSELTSIVVTPSSSLGKETFDTPSVKMEGDKKGRLRKDRYSALLYANYYARNKNKDEVLKIEYKAVGGTRDTVRRQSVPESTSMYYGRGVFRAGSNNWIKSGSPKFIKR